MSRQSISWLLSSALLLASSAWSAESTALHPCIIVGDEPSPETLQLQSLCAREVSLRGMELTDIQRVTASLSLEPGQSCAVSLQREACLGRVALTSGATQTLLIIVAPYAPGVRVRGLLVNASGHVLEEKGLELPRSTTVPLNQTVTRALRQLLDTLTFTSAELAPLVSEPRPSAAPAVVQIARQEEPPSTLHWRKPAAISAAGLSAVSLGMAVLFAVQAEHRFDRLDAAYANGRVPSLEQRGQLSLLQEEAQQRRGLAYASGGMALALGAVSAFLFLTDIPRSTATDANKSAPSLKVGPTSVSLRLPLD